MSVEEISNRWKGSLKKRDDVASKEFWDFVEKSTEDWRQQQPAWSRGFIIPDLVQAIKDIQFLLARNESLEKGWAIEIRCHREALAKLSDAVKLTARPE